MNKIYRILHAIYIDTTVKMFYTWKYDEICEKTENIKRMNILIIYNYFNIYKYIYNIYICIHIYIIYLIYIKLVTIFDIEIRIGLWIYLESYNIFAQKNELWHFCNNIL